VDAKAVDKLTKDSTKYSEKHLPHSGTGYLGKGEEYKDKGKVVSVLN
jgi:hypothetical protein